MHRGWVKHWRREVDSPIWDQSPLHYKVWQWLKLKADKKTGMVKRSYRGIAQEVAWNERGALRVPDPRTIRDIIGWLVQEGMVTVATCGTSNAQYTEITICNWSTYQWAQEAESNAESSHVPHTMSPLQDSRDVGEVDAVAATARAHEGIYSTDTQWGLPIAGALRDWAILLQRDSWERNLLPPDEGFDADSLCRQVHQASKSPIWTLAPSYSPRVYHLLHRHPAFASSEQRLTQERLQRLNEISLKGNGRPWIKEPLDYFAATRAQDGRYRFAAILANDDGTTAPSAAPAARRETTTERIARLKRELRGGHHAA